ncbi:NKG2-D type II integral membrane protein [Erinaceus europaeus]|uniref:NKG2-D type II integral membrane protein n=1 Tax=Erinaceus europaeus TaxID=9365 RepID=A0ABM3XNH9_ERIEU|nr:NKG2-D type II integral membrane protein [Erinaceus europaeus]
MMSLIRDRWAHHNSEVSESQDYSLELDKHDACPRRQKRIATSMTNKCGENKSPFALARSIAVVMGIRLLLVAVAWSVTFALFNQEVPICLKENYCGPCPESWLCYRNNCYQFSNESKTWYESKASCMNQNSTLLKIYNKEKQDFFKLVKSYHWIGLVRNPPNVSWQWEDGSSLLPDQLTMVEMQNGSCAVYGSSFKGYTESCLTPNTYICMQRNDL